MAKYLRIGGERSSYRLPADTDVEELAASVAEAMRGEQGGVIEVPFEGGDNPLARGVLVLNVGTAAFVHLYDSPDQDALTGELGEAEAPGEGPTSEPEP